MRGEVVNTLFCKLAGLLALACLMCEPALADMKVKTRTSIDGRVEYETLYIKGERRRKEFQNYDRVARIADCANAVAFTVDLDLGEYSTFRLPKWPSRDELEMRAQKVARKPAPKPQHPATQRLERNTTDTGERREIFGYTARHLVTTIKHAPWRGPESRPHAEITEEVINWWYVDDLRVPELCEPSYMLEGHGESGEPFGRLTADGELRASAFPMKWTLTIRRRIVGADGTVREVTTVFAREVIELSTEPLDDGLFEVPKGFKKVRRVEIPR